MILIDPRLPPAAPPPAATPPAPIHLASPAPPRYPRSAMYEAEPLTVSAAERELDGLPLVPCLAGSLAYIKEVRDKCLGAGIPAMAAAPAPGRG